MAEVLVGRVKSGALLPIARDMVNSYRVEVAKRDHYRNARPGVKRRLHSWKTNAAETEIR